MRTVAVLAVDRVIPFDLTTPLGVFGMVQLGGGGRPGYFGTRPGYQVRVCARSARVEAGSFAIQAPWGLDGLVGADTVVVPGVEDTAAELPSRHCHRADRHDRDDDVQTQ